MRRFSNTNTARVGTTTSTEAANEEDNDENHTSILSAVDNVLTEGSKAVEDTISKVNEAGASALNEMRNLVFNAPFSNAFRPQKAGMFRKGATLGQCATGVFVALVELPNDVTISVPVHLDTSGQHTLRWEIPIELPQRVDGKPAVLPPGSLNLYRYPRAFYDHLRKGKASVPSVPELYVIEKILYALITTGSADERHTAFAHRRDGAGATPLHALLVSNTKIALDLCLRVYQKHPTLIAQYHTSRLFLRREWAAHSGVQPARGRTLRVHPPRRLDARTPAAGGNLPGAG